MLLGKVEMSGVVGRMERKEDGGGWEGLLNMWEEWKFLLAD